MKTLRGVAGNEISGQKVEDNAASELTFHRRSIIRGGSLGAPHPEQNNSN